MPRACLLCLTVFYLNLYTEKIIIIYSFRLKLDARKCWWYAIGKGWKPTAQNCLRSDERILVFAAPSMLPKWKTSCNYFKIMLFFVGLEGFWGQPPESNFPPSWATLLALCLNCSTAALTTPQKVLPIWKLVELKMLDFCDCTRTSISILISAADNATLA